ncbi:hypothetical protein ABIA03_004290 [Bradyrhizobium yuanmingense]|uniref:Uncharacterized protein n=2 Tax=Bradyrhizobium yuanmingense TaxID=108015 RepID=A0ABV4GCZ5_9BRAD
MSFRPRRTAVETEVMLRLVLLFQANPVALSDPALSKLIDEALRGEDHDWRPSPRALRRELQRRSASELDLKAVDNGPRVLPTDDSEALP